MSSDGMSVVYVCQTSYTLVGDDTMHCGTDGSGWQGTTPKCGRFIYHMTSVIQWIASPHNEETCLHMQKNGADQRLCFLLHR